MILTGHTFSDEPGVYIEGQVCLPLSMPTYGCAHHSYRSGSVWRIVSTCTRMEPRCCLPRVLGARPEILGILKRTILIRFRLRVVRALYSSYRLNTDAFWDLHVLPYFVGVSTARSRWLEARHCTRIQPGM